MTQVKPSKNGHMYQVLGETVRIVSRSDEGLAEQIPAANYSVSQNPMTGEFYLSRIDPFVLPKLYGEFEKKASRILQTFRDRPNSTGVLLAGEKGGGKSLLAKTVAHLGKKTGLATIMVNAPFHGDEFNRFVQSIGQPAIFLFDEFEKVYKMDAEGNPQEGMLTLLDGVFPTKKLFILTCNNKWEIDTNLVNRPGRVYYFMEFEGVSEEFVLEYCRDNLKNQEHNRGVVALSKMFYHFNFDQLKAVVEEMNRYNESPAEAVAMLNIKMSELNRDRSFKISLRKGQKSFVIDPDRTEVTGDPLTGSFTALYYKDAKAEKIDEGTAFTVTGRNISAVVNGQYIYERDGWTVTLTEAPNKEFNISEHLERSLAF